MRLVVIAMALAVGWFGFRWFMRQSVATRWRAVVVAVLLLLSVTGRLHWLLALGAALLLAWQRVRQGQTGGQPTGGRHSVVETRLLRMTLDHDSGAMDGRVLGGVFAGRSLAELSLQQLRELLDECRRDDGDSAALLLSYLQRMHGDEWQASDEAEEHGPTGGDGGEMSVREALDILGLEEGTDDSRVHEAHRRLMQKLHPDRGGSNYLASKVNQARDRLLRDT